MSGLSRRDFVFVSSGAVAGNFVAPGLTAAEDDHAHDLDFSRSGLVTGQPKPLKHKSIPGFLSDPQEDVRTAIGKRFGSLEKWADDFQASAKAAAGWAMLTFHPVNGNLYNVVSDEHAMGPIWMGIPLVVIDVYEHAFYIDYQNRKAEYIEKFMDHIDWDEVNNRYRAASA